MKKFKNKLLGKRITLKITKPDIETAEAMFKVICVNRRHLRPWLPWEKKTKKMEDSLSYLLDKEKKVEAGEKVEYGIYIGPKYIGNIAIFNIDSIKKSGEIGYWLSSGFTKHGYMKEAVMILEKEFFKYYGLNRIQIKCDEANIASSNVAKKCGFILEGKHREDSFSEYFNSFRNTLVYSKLKSDYVLNRRLRKRTEKG